uniref:Uncharacterized protein n=1 Tax=Schistosoma japonicum TaxID=6182 RepID=Q5BYK7_SCHJA|nr:unknown [Schistosoma japonicum]
MTLPKQSTSNMVMFIFRQIFFQCVQEFSKTFCLIAASLNLFKCLSQKFD